MEEQLITKETCAYCTNTDICKYGSKSEPICFKCAGMPKEEVLGRRGTNKTPKKKKRKRK